MTDFVRTSSAIATLGGLAAAVVPVAVLAQDQALPAVSGPNAKVSLGYGSISGDSDSEDFFLSGALSFPVTHRLGAQLDLAVTDKMTGAGLHLFLRDPSRYLVGVYVDRLEHDTPTGTARHLRYGVEAEGYFADVTVAGFLGRDEVRGAAPNNSFSVVDLDVDYYINDNTMLSAGLERSYDRDGASIGLTHLYANGATPFAVSASIGSDDGDIGGAIGVTFFFGNSGDTLKAIHRQDDPRIRIGGSPTRSGYFDALRNGTIGAPVRTPTPCTGKACPT